MGSIPWTLCDDIGRATSWRRRSRTGENVRDTKGVFRQVFISGAMFCEVNTLANSSVVVSCWSDWPACFIQRISDSVFLHEFFVDGDPQARLAGDPYEPVLDLDLPFG